jgi:hypothetical protein
LAILGIFTALGVSGRTFQMRFVAMAVVPLSMLLGPLLDGLRGRSSLAATAAVGAALFWNAATAYWYLLHPEIADPISLAEVLTGRLYGD